jgi:hypothetical protein
VSRIFDEKSNFQLTKKQTKKINLCKYLMHRQGKTLQNQGRKEYFPNKVLPTIEFAGKNILSLHLFSPNIQK